MPRGVILPALMFKRITPCLPPALLALALVAGFGSDSFAQGTIVLVRHAERADAGTGPPTMAADPSLSDAGRARAASLAAMLKDAGVTAIFATEFKRTQETAMPLARALGLEPTTVPAKDVTGLVDRLRKARGTVLVVGHSNTVPEIIKALGVPTAPSIADDEYDNLFIVSTAATPQLLRLRFR